MGGGRGLKRAVGPRWLIVPKCQEPEFSRRSSSSPVDSRPSLITLPESTRTIFLPAVKWNIEPLKSVTLTATQIKDVLLLCFLFSFILCF